MAINLFTNEPSFPEYLYRTASAPDYRSAYSVHYRLRITELPDGPASVRAALWHLNAGGTACDWIYIDGAEGYRLVLRIVNEAGANLGFIVGTTVLAPGVDYDFVIKRTSSTHTAIYLDGVLEAEVTQSAPHPSASTRFAIGSLGNGVDYLDAAISDIGIWLEALSDVNRALIASDGCDAYSTNLWERWSGLTHVDLGGDVNGLALSAYGVHTTSEHPHVPGMTPVDPLLPAYLVIATQPNGARKNSAFAIQPIIHIYNLNGEIATGAAIEVTAAVSGGPGTLTGDVGVVSVAGVTTFTDLQLSAIGEHELTFTAPDLVTVVSEEFTVGQAYAPTGRIIAQARNAALENLPGKTYSWVSSNEAIATVDSDGVVRAVAAGTCTVTPTCEGVDGDARDVTVLAAETP